MCGTWLPPHWLHLPTLPTVQYPGHSGGDLSPCTRRTKHGKATHTGKDPGDLGGEVESAVPLRAENQAEWERTVVMKAFSLDW